MLSGIITALVTPFKDDKFDSVAFKDLVKWQIQEGVNGLAVNGATGESPTVEEDELIQMIEIATTLAKSKVPVLVGTGLNSTKRSIKLTQMAQKMGASAALIVSPYYNKPTQAGIYEHYKAIHDETDIPIIVYNVPARAIIDIGLDTLERLIGLKRIAGIKDCSHDVERPIAIKRMLKKSGRSDFSLLTGDDSEALAFGVSGGHGCISVTSNIVPRELAQMQKAIANNNFADALKIHSRLLNLNKTLFCETNPIPVKYALHLMGKISSEVRLPLTVPSDSSKNQIKLALHELGLI